LSMAGSVVVGAGPRVDRSSHCRSPLCAQWCAGQRGLRSQPWGGAVNCNKAEKLEADLRPGGFEVVNEPGTPAYHQLTTSAYGQGAGLLPAGARVADRDGLRYRRIPLLHRWPEFW